MSSNMSFNNTSLFFRVTMLGCTNVGKTSIIRRFVNNDFSSKYNPTIKLDKYVRKFNLNEDEVTQKTYVYLILEDTFGTNNAYLNKNPKLILTEEVLKTRDRLVNDWRHIMLTSTEMRNKLMNDEKKAKINTKHTIDLKEEFQHLIYGKESEQFPRNGFIFVCDCERKETLEKMISIIEKLQEIEKGSNLCYPKMILFNKGDKVNDKAFKEIVQKYQTQLETFKDKFKMEILKVSAKTGVGIEDSMRRFLSRIHQEQKNQGKNDEITEPDEEDDQRIYKPGCVDNMNSLSKKMFCGKSMFSCFDKGDSDEDNQ